ncbi:excisionase family DNA-binding protein [uncultured Pseudoteredinibacter sp.]|uniref:excisionase family DNA-binding protein n=1 Tax=uncultured Pseudoteredinibacter sp. TaxID=1641701 RepID=UPI002625D038|nr:excisionase family DNA-binding protein [uncultured Pseudoteredinibacter sp.]
MESNFRTPVQLSVLPPVMGQEQFATYCGTTKDTVRGWIQAGTLPSVKIGRQRLVNLSLLQDELKAGKEFFESGEYSGS